MSDTALSAALTEQTLSSEAVFARYFEQDTVGSPGRYLVTQPVSAEHCFSRFFDAANGAAFDAHAAVIKTPVTPVTPVTPAAPVPPILKEEPAKLTLLARFKSGMKKTRSNLTQGISTLFSSKTKFDKAFFDDLETQLIMADVGVPTTETIVSQLKAYAQEKGFVDQPEAQQALKNHLKLLLAEALVKRPEELDGEKHLHPVKSGTQMILIVGVNGVGKTTTIGKLAHHALSEGKSVMLAAGDTFRAAAVEQLQVWGDRTGVPVIAQAQGSDSASVIFDALQSAQAKGIDLLIADTAGRLHNKANLMQELQKIVRVVKKINPEAPHKVFLVLDGCTGQNALSQGRVFNEAVPLSGLVITKLDGTAKGGIVFALSQSLGIPVEYIGIGEGVEDLRRFDRHAYVDALLDLD